jgi:hypothetical protein
VPKQPPDSAGDRRPHRRKLGVSPVDLIMGQAWFGPTCHAGPDVVVTSGPSVDVKDVNSSTVVLISLFLRQPELMLV